MQEIIKVGKSRKSRIINYSIIIGLLAGVGFSIIMSGKIETLSYTKNINVVSSKIKESQVNLSSNKDESNTTKDQRDMKKQEVELPKEVNSTNNGQVTLPQKNESNSQAVNVEQALVEDGRKTAYLTFDDGPSVTVTPRILDTLKQYKVNATFFVLGASIEEDEGCKELIKRTLKEGNSIGNHSYSHNIKKLYGHNKVNVEYFMEEVDKTNNVLKEIIGQDFNTRIIRMPGGYMSREYYSDPNLPVFDAKLKEKNMCNIDWNAYNKDSEGKWKNAAQLLKEVKSTVGDKEKVVILMHDTYGKEETAKSLPQVIEYLKSQGYEFKTLK